MSIAEQLTFDQAKEITAQIRGGVENVSLLLKQAFDGNAWGALGYTDWRTYAMQEFQMSQSRAYQILDHAKVQESFSTMVEKPATERQTRELSKLETPEEQVEAWSTAVETAQSEGRQQPTAKHVEAAVEEIKGRSGSGSGNYHPANGLMYADNAISQLKKIKPNDTQRSRAFNRILKWIEENK